jgi:hypothetical protein
MSEKNLERETGFEPALFNGNGEAIAQTLLGLDQIFRNLPQTRRSIAGLDILHDLIRFGSLSFVSGTWNCIPSPFKV